MRIEVLPFPFTVCQMAEWPCINAPFTFISRTDEEISLVCPSAYVPGDCLKREDGWRGMRIQGILDFSMTGILAGIAGTLAAHKIPLFALSTYNTDYVLVKEENLPAAREALWTAGYEMQ